MNVVFNIETESRKSLILLKIETTRLKGLGIMCHFNFN